MKQFRELIIISFKYDGKYCFLPRILSWGNLKHRIEKKELLRKLSEELRQQPGVENVRCYTNASPWDDRIMEKFYQYFQPAANAQIAYLNFDRQVFNTTPDYDYENDSLYWKGRVQQNTFPVRVVDWNYGYFLDETILPIVITNEYTENIDEFKFEKLD